MTWAACARTLPTAGLCLDRTGKGIGCCAEVLRFGIPDTSILFRTLLQSLRHINSIFLINKYLVSLLLIHIYLMTTSENMSRKRPAPGASPLGFQSQPQQLSDHHYANSAQPLTDDQFFDWGANAHNPNAYSNQPIYGMPANANMYQNQPSVSPSNQLTRRPVNPVMARPPALNSQWMNESPVTTPVQQQDPAATWSDDIEELVAKAQIAKKDAQSRRKQIPPFVMKLHRLVRMAKPLFFADKHELSRKP